MDDLIIGNPLDQSAFWEQQIAPDNCAVVAEMSIINQFGHDLDQDEANFISSSHGWYREGEGTSMGHLGNMMEHYGIPNHSVSNATLDDLARELKAGHGVIVGVNSDELWETGLLADLKGFLCEQFGIDLDSFSPADHAVVVTGIDTSDPANPMVLLNDSGSPGGAAASYPLEKFMDAWDNGSFHYTATDEPLPSLKAGQAAEGVDWSRWLTAIATVGSSAVAAYVGYEVTEDAWASMEFGYEVGCFVEQLYEDPEAIRFI